MRKLSLHDVALFACEFAYPDAVHRREARVNGTTVEACWAAGVAQRVTGHGFADPRTVSAENASAVAGTLTAARLRVFAVRGTNDGRNMLDDVRVSQTDEASPYGVGVHTGFALHADKLWESLQQEADLAAAAGNTLLLTGHSLGGVTAIALGDRLSRQRGQRIRVVTFGSPRYGSPAACFRVSKTCHISRFALSRDCVPRSPPVWTCCPRGKWSHPSGTWYSGGTAVWRWQPPANSFWGDLWQFGEDLVILAEMTAAAIASRSLSWAFWRSALNAGREIANKVAEAHDRYTYLYVSGGWPAGLSAAVGLGVTEAPDA